MEISSAPGGGTVVNIEVPVPRRLNDLPLFTEDPTAWSGPTPSDATKNHSSIPLDQLRSGRTVGFFGYDREGSCPFGLPRLGLTLERDFEKMGCRVVPIEEADLIIADGRVEETTEALSLLRQAKTDDIVFLIAADHEAHPEVVCEEVDLGKRIRRYRKPGIPSTLREILFPGYRKALKTDLSALSGRTSSIHSPDLLNSGHARSESSVTMSDSPRVVSPSPNQATALTESPKATLHPTFEKSTPSPRRSLAGLFGWKPKGMSTEECVASLCLGDYFGSRRKLSRTSSQNSSDAHSIHSAGSSSAYENTPTLENNTSMEDAASPYPDGVRTPSEETLADEEEEEHVKVLVVEDNVINRKILVKILQSKLISESRLVSRAVFFVPLLRIAH